MKFIKMDSDGVQISSLEDIVTDFSEGMSKIYKDKTVLDANSIDGQLVALCSQIMTDFMIDEFNIIQGYRFPTAVGIQLDDLATFVNAKRLEIPESLYINAKSIKEAILQNNYYFEFEGKRFLIPAGTKIISGNNYLTLYLDIKKDEETQNVLELIPSDQIEVLSDIIEERDESDEDFRKRIMNTKNFVNSATYIGLEKAIKALPTVNDAKIYDNPSINVDSIGVPPKSIWIIVDTNDFTSVANLVYNNIPPHVEITKGDIVVKVPTEYKPYEVRMDLVVYVPLYISSVIISATNESGTISQINDLKKAITQNIRSGIGEIIADSEVIGFMSMHNKSFRYLKTKLYLLRDGKEFPVVVKPNERLVIYEENIKFDTSSGN